MKHKWVVLVILLSAFVSAQKVKPTLYFGVDSDSFSTNGRWIPSDPKDKAAFQSETQIDCDRRTKSCVEATAEYYSGHPHVSLAYFEIVKWDENSIIATSSGAICMAETILISIQDRSISATHSIKKLDNGVKEACKSIGVSGTSAEVFVIKNSPRWNDDPYGASKH